MQMIIIKAKTVAFIGQELLRTSNSRPDANLQNVVRTEVRSALDALYGRGFRVFLSGMGVGFGMIAAQVVVEFKKQHDDVKLYAVIPFQGQELRYPDQDRLLYHQIFDQVDDSILVDDNYSADSYFRQNDFLVDNSSQIICYCAAGEPQTEYLEDVANKNGVCITNLYAVLADYFDNNSAAKRQLQKYSSITSICFTSDGIMACAANSDHLFAHFDEIVSIDSDDLYLNITLDNGTVVKASLIADDCQILPSPLGSQPSLMKKVMHKIFHN